MTANVDAMVRAGVEAYRAGKRSEARTLLERAIELDEQNEQAWLWLSAVVDSTDDQIVCLQNVLIINPQNERARQGLRSLGVDPNTVVAESPTPEADPSEPISAFETGTFDEYAVPSSSVSVSNAGSEITSDDYDAWMENLNLGGSENTEAALADDDPFGDSGSDIFGDVDFSADSSVSLDDDPFGDADFGSTAADPFADDRDDVYTDDYADVLGDSATDDADLLDLGDESIDDLLGGGDDLLTDDLLVDPIDDYNDDYDSYSDDGIYDDDLLDDNISYAEPNSLRAIVGEYTTKIPPGVEPTRMPGIDATVPRSARIITGILAVINVAAIGLIAFAAFQLAM